MPIPEQAGARPNCGVVILCGGRSQRMGRDKALLSFGPATLLEYVIGSVNRLGCTVMVVAARGQFLPVLPASVQVVHDEFADRGPLEGLRVGLTAARRLGLERVFACACDTPLIQPAVIERLLAAAMNVEVCVLSDQQQPQPLLAVYSTYLIERIETLLASGAPGPRALIGQSQVCQVDAESLRDIDPDLTCLLNVNTPDAYRAALVLAGFEG